MRFQIVLQWPASSIGDYDEIVYVEDFLTRNLATMLDLVK